MSSRELPHVQDEDLFKLLDHELADTRAETAIMSHLDNCPACSRRMRDFETAIGDYARYRETVVKPLMPPPPSPWIDLRAKLQELDESSPRPPRHPAGRRIAGYLRPAHWLAAAACLILAFVLTRRFERVPSVSAAELLRKATAADSSSGLHRRIQIRTSRRTFSRPAVVANTVPSAAPDLRQLFDTAHFDWQDPLSARSYAAWHDRLPDKQDSVENVPAGRNSAAAIYVIKTSTSASTLRTATLTLRVQDLRPIRELLEFTSETVEITDAPESSSEDLAGKPAVPSAAPERSASPELSARPSDESAIKTKLEVFSALHRIEADLGEPIEVHQSGSRLLVTGTGLAATQKERLQAALAGIHGVELRFDEAHPHPQMTGKPDETTAPEAVHTRERLQTLLGDSVSIEVFIDHALDASDSMMSRVHALRALARAFPREVESSLSEQDRSVLAGLRRDHTAALRKRITELQQLLKPLVTIGPRVVAPAPPPSNWQLGVETLFTAAQEFDDALNSVMAAAAPADSDVSFGTVSAALARLQSQFTAFEKASP